MPTDSDITEFFKDKDVKIIVNRRAKGTIEISGRVKGIVPGESIDVESGRYLFAGLNHGIAEIQGVDGQVLYNNPAVPKEYAKAMNNAPALQFMNPKMLLELYREFFAPVREQGQFYIH